MSDLILFDIDHTLLEPERLLRGGFHPRLAQLAGWSVDEVQTQLDEYWQQLASPRDFTWQAYREFVVERLGLSAAQVASVLDDEVIYRQAVMPEATAVLEQLKERGYRLGIRSHGDPEFQRLKLERSGLVQWFDPVHLFFWRDKNAPEAIEVLPASTVVDDDLRSLEPLAGDERFLPVWFNARSLPRPETWQQRPMIASLAELLSFL